MRYIFQTIITYLAQRVLVRYSPKVIGITGSVGKTTAKDTLFALLSCKFSVRANVGNLNNEFGVTFTILGIGPYRTFGQKVFVLFDVLKAFFLAFGPRIHYPKILILEMGADHPGDIAQLTRIAKPNIGLVTAVGEVPVHVQYYASPQEVAYEKSQLPRSIASDGLVVLNYDDQSVLDMREHTRAHVATFGFSQNADIFVEDYTYALPSLDDVGDIGMYVRFRVHVHTLEVFLPHIIAKHQLYPIMGAIAIAWHLGISQENIIDSLKHISLSPGRMQMAEGFHDIFVIDDTYNSSPLAAHAALDVLKELGDFVIAKRGVGRKIAILGDMRELGDYSIDQHRQLGARAGAVADLVVAVGDMRGYITEGALTRLSKEQVISFEDADRAASAIAQYLEPHDLVLIKGSRSVHMEKVVNILAVSH